MDLLIELDPIPIEYWFQPHDSHLLLCGLLQS
jgi:hypothetical protein